jgi:hypothetical protein
MIVGVHTDSWFTGRITVSGVCCALLSDFVFRSLFNETRSLREFMPGDGGVNRLFTDSYRRYKSFVTTFPINFFFTSSSFPFRETSSTVVNILSADSETVLTVVKLLSTDSETVLKGFKPLSTDSDTVLKGFKPLSADSDAVSKGFKPLSADSDAVSKGFKPLSADSDAIFTQLNISNYNTYSIFINPLKNFRYENFKNKFLQTA